MTETMVLEDAGEGQTKMTTTSVFKTREDLEGMVNSGMEKGSTESWDRFAELVETP